MTPTCRPGAVTALRAAAADADAALVVTPEYNGSYPAVIKNAIDWLSRPFGDGALKGKPLAVIGGSFGQYGGVWAHDDTRKSFGIAGPARRRDDQAVGAVQDAGWPAPARARRSGRATCATRSANWPPKSADFCNAPQRFARRWGALLGALGRHVLSVPGGRPDLYTTRETNL